jgi:hypothetical protein
MSLSWLRKAGALIFIFPLCEFIVLGSAYETAASWIVNPKVASRPERVVGIPVVNNSEKAKLDGKRSLNRVYHFLCERAVPLHLERSLLP